MEMQDTQTIRRCPLRKHRNKFPLSKDVRHLLIDDFGVTATAAP